MKKAQAIGIDLGGTKIQGGVVNAQGEILKAVKQPTPIDAGGKAIMASIAAVARQLMEAYGLMPVGIASPGLISFPEGVVLGCTPNLPEWLGRSLREAFEQELKTPVIVDNDARAATWGEYRLGQGRGMRHFVMLTLGTGLGSGIVAGGELLRNPQGLGIGYGHMIVDWDGRWCNCGQRGCLEAYVSGKGLAAGYRELGGEPGIEGPEIFRRAEQGEALALAAIDQMLTLLAVGIANIFNTLAPERLALGGGISEQGRERLLQPLRQKISQVMSMPPKDFELLQLADLGERAGLIGAALLAMEYAGP